MTPNSRVGKGSPLEEKDNADLQTSKVPRTAITCGGKNGVLQCFGVKEGLRASEEERAIPTELRNCLDPYQHYVDVEDSGEAARSNLKAVCSNVYSEEKTRLVVRSTFKLVDQKPRS
jgi:hypothetical protein